MRASYSSLSTCALCPRKWYLTTRWNPKMRPVPFSEGDIVHTVLAKIYVCKNIGLWESVFEMLVGLAERYAERISPKVKTEISGKLAQARSSLKCYMEFIMPSDLSRYEVLEAEQKHTVILEGGLEIPGMTDMVVEDRKMRRKYIFEHKFKAAFDGEAVEKDSQVSLYTLGKVQKYGILPTLYNTLVKPQLKTTKSNPASLLGPRSLEKISEDVKGLKYGLEFSTKYFIRRIYHRGRTALRNVIDDSVAIAEQMERIKVDPSKAYRNVGQHCSWCQVRALCVEEDELIAARLFVPRNRKKNPI